MLITILDIEAEASIYDFDIKDLDNHNFGNISKLFLY